MKLENLMYESDKGKERIYSVGDLEYFSSSALYTGDLPPMGPGGCFELPKGDGYNSIIPIFTIDGTVDSNSLGMYEPLKIQPSPNLTIRDFPASGFQLHIHEEAGSKAKLKGYNGQSIEINSYDAAMADGGKPAYDAMEKLNESLHRLYGSDILKGMSEIRNKYSKTEE